MQFFTAFGLIVLGLWLMLFGLRGWTGDATSLPSILAPMVALYSFVLAEVVTSMVGLIQRELRSDGVRAPQNLPLD